MTKSPSEALAEQDLLKLRSVFVDADFIALDGWVGRLAWEWVWRAKEAGWLSFDERTSSRNSDDQYTAACYRPTPLLREILATQEAPHGE